MGLNRLKDKHGPRINTIGVLVVDVLSGPLSRYPEPGKHAQVITDWVRMMPGGGAANTGGALGRMGFDVGVFSKVGRDTNGDFILGELARSGADTSGVAVSSSDSTPFTYVSVWKGGDRTFVHTPGANKTFSADDLDVGKLLSTDFLIYQDLCVLPMLDGLPGAEILKDARARGIVTLLDECWGLGPDRSIFETMLPYCDYVMPSLDDMLAIYPGMDETQIAAHILAKGPAAVIIKMGSRGCLVCRGDERTHVLALPADVVDTTGAGDCWDAGFAAGLAEGEDLITAARIGNACAAFCVEAVGGCAGVPDYAAVRERAG